MLQNHILKIDGDFQRGQGVGYAIGNIVVPVVPWSTNGYCHDEYIVSITKEKCDVVAFNVLSFTNCLSSQGLAGKCLVEHLGMIKD